MTTTVEDPLIAGMEIAGTLPLHESSRRLRELCPDSPRVHGVAVMADLSRRRWWPLASALTSDRLQAMFDAANAEMEARAAAQQLAAALIHVVLGRVVPLVVLEGRAWDAGLENLWVHVDAEGTIDWVGVVDPTLRVLPDDGACDGVVRLPGEAALTMWVAHRSHGSLAALFAKLGGVCGGAMSIASMWHLAGSAVVGAATQVPLLAGSSELLSMRRSQAVLDALVGFGAPVRGTADWRSGKALRN
jgi:hypothetical protein